jgi:hypothetical protein
MPSGHSVCSRDITGRNTLVGLSFSAIPGEKRAGKSHELRYMLQLTICVNVANEKAKA